MIPKINTNMYVDYELNKPVFATNRFKIKWIMFCPDLIQRGWVGWVSMEPRPISGQIAISRIWWLCPYLPYNHHFELYVKIIQVSDPHNSL